jgi:uncharacterized protein (TIGR02246 family)
MNKLKMKYFILGSIFSILGCNNSYPAINNNNSSTMKANEEDLIIHATQEFLVAWNKGDAKAASLFYTDDGVRVGAFGDKQHGRQEIEVAYDKLLHQTMPGATVKQERGSVRMLTPDLAIWQGGIEILPSGTTVPLKGHVIQVMKKVKDQWLILEAHPKLFPPPKH